MLAEHLAPCMAEAAAALQRETVSASSKRTETNGDGCKQADNPNWREWVAEPREGGEGSVGNGETQG